MRTRLGLLDRYEMRKTKFDSLSVFVKQFISNAVLKDRTQHLINCLSISKPYYKKFQSA